MNYIGAADYYFWQGVRKGNKSSINDLQYDIDQFYIFGNNDVSKACYEAYKWGYIWGINLTQEEYLDLTNDPINVTIEEINEAFDKVYKELNIEGNC